MNNVKVYDEKIILGISFGFLGLTALFTLLYQQLVLRMILIVILLILIFIYRNKFIRAFKKIKSNKV